MTAALSGSSRQFSESLDKALNAWPDIALAFRQLFDRAPTEALVDIDVRLARMAAESVGRLVCSHETTDLVSRKVQASIADRQPRNQALVMRALTESASTLDDLDTAISAVKCQSVPLDKWQAMAESQRIVALCQRFDRALSTIPALLRNNDGQ